MSITTLLLVIIGLSAIGFVTSQRRARALFAGRDYRQVHSRPHQHGLFAAVLAGLPALALVLVWMLVRENMVMPAALASLPAELQNGQGLGGMSVQGAIRRAASGDMAAIPAIQAAGAVYREMLARWDWVITGLAGALGLLGIAYAFMSVKAETRARTRVEKVAMVLLVAASTMAILTTLGIVLSLLFESLRFFQQVSPVEFLFGTSWSPQTAIRADQVGSSGAFGAVPLFWGTFFIAMIAMVVAVPIGLFSAIFLTQYASRRLRSWMKPVLEVLAGVPTVVYGYFAALTLAPQVRRFAEWAGMASPSSESALAAGLVMGVMIIPFMSSMADDAIAAVPAAMRDGSLAMGATPSETIKQVIIPAALPGIVGGFLLSISRAIGETMIVVMAAGLAANLTANPFDSVTTVTTQIVKLLTGDQEFDSAKTLSAFALGLVLFFATLLLNVFALRVVKKYREAYE